MATNLKKEQEAVEDYRQAVESIAATEIAALFINKQLVPKKGQDGLLEALFQRVSLDNWHWPKEIEAAEEAWEALLECGRGWYSIITALNIHLAAISPEYEISQIKEKFGGLRFYANINLSDEQNDEHQFNSLIFDRLILEAESMAAETCETCGKPGLLYGKGGRAIWYKTLCAECSLELGFEFAYPNMKRSSLLAIQEGTRQAAAGQLIYNPKAWEEGVKLADSIPEPGEDS